MRLTPFAAFAAAVLSACGQTEPPVAADPASPPAEAAGQPAAAPNGQPTAGPPQPPHGLWRITLDGAGSMPAVCGTGDNVEALRQAQASEGGGRLCNPDNPFRREGAAWVTRTTCDLHAGGRSQTVMMVTGDMNTRFRVEVATTFTDVPYDSMPGTRIGYTVERIGDC